ncbi:MAG: hypothetical protein KBD16_00330 [Candidatus Pacebacteria bacterium]|nr:hypothetical protein [Candidatus Paceibacterota bacterium]
MVFENVHQSEATEHPSLEVEASFEGFVPDEFRSDPLGYFETKGRNIKSGEITYDEQGVAREDPTATKDLPVWRNEDGGELHVVGKKVNTSKSHVGKSEDPFYEYSIMEIAREFGLPAARPIAKAQRGSDHLIIMEKIEGIRWTEEGMKPILEARLSDSEKAEMLAEAERLMTSLQVRYEHIGLIRTWKLKDMVCDVDIPNRKVRGLVPTDWERTKINKPMLVKAREEKGM